MSDHDQKQYDNAHLGATITSPDSSLLRKWLIALGRDRAAIAGTKCVDSPEALGIDKATVKRWKRIGAEVFERKVMLIAAAEDLRANGIQNHLKLAATDIFAEKAQRMLTLRGRWLYTCGALAAVLACVVLSAAAWFSHEAILHLQSYTSSSQFSGAYVTMWIFARTAFGAFIGAGVYLLVSISRALLHEATVLYNRRHALRFGRLAVYVSEGTLKYEDLEKAFAWNSQYESAFRDIDPENAAAKSLLLKMVEQPALLARVFQEWSKEQSAKAESPK